MILVKTNHPSLRWDVTKDLGKLTYFLGIVVHHSSDGLILTQHKYVHDLLLCTNMENSKVSPPLCYLLRSCSSVMVLLSLLLMLQIIGAWSVPFHIYPLHNMLFLSPLIGCASFSAHQPRHIGRMWSVFSIIYERPLLSVFTLPSLAPHY
jgi:hypothetical protein